MRGGTFILEDRKWIATMFHWGLNVESMPFQKGDGFLGMVRWISAATISNDTVAYGSSKAKFVPLERTRLIPCDAQASSPQNNKRSTLLAKFLAKARC
jgi:hypothetical protein